AADVAGARSAATSPGGTAAGVGLDNGQPVIAKTGTTNLSQSAYFMAATPKYAMADAMFVNHPNCPPRLGSACSADSALAYAPPAGVQTLFGVGGMSGYGGGGRGGRGGERLVEEIRQEAGVPVPPGEQQRGG